MLIMLQKMEFRKSEMLANVEINKNVLIFVPGVKCCCECVESCRQMDGVLCQIQKVKETLSSLDEALICQTMLIPAAVHCALKTAAPS